MISILLLAGVIQSTLAWVVPVSTRSGVSSSTVNAHQRPSLPLWASNKESCLDDQQAFKNDHRLLQRRDWFFETTFTSIALVVTSSTTRAAHAEVVRAVGSGELDCREKGNCLQVGEWDGAIGWNWGAPDRCDPSDPLCGSDGRLRDTPVVGQPVPEPVSDITHVAAIELEIGRGEVGVLRMGFYGNEAPAGVQEMLDFLSVGITTTTKNAENVLGTAQAPVALRRGGIVNSITPGLTVDFGVPSQAYAYARSRGMSKAGDFLPQTRPDSSLMTQDKSARSHSCAGLVSIPKKGLGYGGSGFEQDDEAFESTFLVTAGSVPALDKNRLVVGQILDAQSMAFLERLASLATKKGIKGVIPGQTSGPPLLKVAVQETEVSRVASSKTMT